MVIFDFDTRFKITTDFILDSTQVPMLNQGCSSASNPKSWVGFRRVNKTYFPDATATTQLQHRCCSPTFELFFTNCVRSPFE